MQKKDMNYSIREQELPKDVKKELEIYPELLGQLLFARGIETMKDADRFLNPNYERDIHDPFTMKDMEKAVDRILEAIKKEEKILIFSDYDADGIPGAVVLHDFFQKISYKNFENYIPHRHNEGYGLNIKAIEKFSDNEVDLIITIDCGITNIGEVAEINKLGMEVIITDHHIVGEDLPKACAILNPKQEGCSYPDDMLAGAGVVFKLVQALIKNGEFEIKEGWDKWLLDMVGLATISDMVPLKNENRVFSFYGMKVLRKSPRAGLIHLLRKLKVNQKTLTEDDLAFMITPRINAASRIDDPIKAFEMLSATDEAMAGELANYLDSINSKRKTMVASMVKEANKKLKERNLGEVIVIGSPKWNPGVSGLVASSLVEKYGKPAFVWGEGGDGSIKGSCRSCNGINIVDLMKKAGDVFDDVGGHTMAGGFTVTDGGIHNLEERLNKVMTEIEKGEDDSGIIVDKKINLDDVNWENYNQIEKMAPFGMGNSKPIFLIEGVEIFNVKVFGKQSNHLGLDFKNSKGQNISSIKFFAEEIEGGETKLSRGDKVNVIINLEKSTFRNVNELRMRIVEVFSI